MFGLSKTSMLSTNTQSSFASVVFDDVLEHLRLSQDRRRTPYSLYQCSFGRNARGKLRALERHSVSSKSPSRGQDGDERVAGRNVREKYIFP